MNTANLLAVARKAGHLISRGVAALLIAFIRVYQSLHIAFFRGSCRFHPTCSHYALDAIRLHGPGRGTLLTTWRVLRCQPFCRGGYDPVPEPRPNRRTGLRKPTENPIDHDGMTNRAENITFNGA